MLESVSAIGLQIGIAAIYWLAERGSAVSEEAEVVQARARAIVLRVENSDALFGNRVAVMSALRGLSRHHGVEGWDGGGADPVNADSIARATAFVRALPEGCDMPEVSVDPDGAVALDWLPSRHRMMSISISGTNDRLAYAWIDGADRGSAVSRFDGSAIPQRLFLAIKAVSTVPAHVVLRAA